MNDNLQIVRLWISVVTVLVGAFTAGQYYFQHRKMTRFAFSVWRERRLACVALLAAAWYFAPDMLRTGNTLIAALFDH